MELQLDKILWHTLGLYPSKTEDKNKNDKIDKKFYTKKLKGIS